MVLIYKPSKTNTQLQDNDFHRQQHTKDLNLSSEMNLEVQFHCRKPIYYVPKLLNNNNFK